MRVGAVNAKTPLCDVDSTALSTTSSLPAEYGGAARADGGRALSSSASSSSSSSSSTWNRVVRSASAIAACVGLASLVVASHRAQKFASLGDSAEFTDDATDWSPYATPAVSGDSLLGVKFYVYDDFAVPSRLTLDGKPLPVRLETLDPKKPTHTVSPSLVKHLDDVLLARQAVRHPMRTHNASEAALFYVPTPLNAVSMFGQRLCHHTKDGETLCGREILKRDGKALRESKWYQKSLGRDHVVVMSSYIHDYLKRKEVHLDEYNTNVFQSRVGAAPGISTSSHDFDFADYAPMSMLRCNHITWENRVMRVPQNGELKLPERFALPSFYVGRRCSVRQGPVSNDFALIASFETWNQKIGERIKLCDVLKRNDSSFRVDACGPGKQCPALAQAKFGFHVPGDTPGSNRLMDTILSGTVPIFTHEKQYGVLPSFIDWRKLSYFADIKADRKTLVRSLRAIVQDERGYAKRRKAVLRNLKLFDFSTKLPFEMYMYHFSLLIYPNLEPRPQRFAPSDAFCTARLTDINATSVARRRR